VGRELAAPPKNSALGLWHRISALRVSGFPPKDVGSVSNQIAAKGSASLKRLKNTGVWSLPWWAVPKVEKTVWTSQSMLRQNTADLALLNFGDQSGGLCNGCVLFQNLTNLDQSQRNAPRSKSNLICSDTSERIWLSHAHLCCRRSLFTCKRGRGLQCSVQTRTRWPRPLWPERSVCSFSPDWIDLVWQI